MSLGPVPKMLFGRAADEWKLLQIAAPHLTAQHHSLAESYCRSIAALEAMQLDLDAMVADGEKLTEINGAGNTRPIGLVTAVQKQTQVALAVAQKLGITVTAASRLPANERAAGGQAHSLSSRLDELDKQSRN